MKLVRKVLRWSWRLLRWLMLACLAYLVAAGLGTLIPLAGEGKRQAGIEIFVSSNGVHADLCLPLRQSNLDWTQHFAIAEDFPGMDLEYLCFGWGDLDFFVNTPTWADLSLGTALHSALWPSRAAMHVTPWTHAPAITTRCRSLLLNEDQYQRLCQHILDHLPLNEQGRARKIAPGYGAGDAFYEASGRYHLFRTCNEWTSEGLAAAGIQTALWAPFAQSVLVHVP